MKKIVATAAIAAALLSTSVSEASNQLIDDSEQRHPVVNSSQSADTDEYPSPLLPDGTTNVTYQVDASSTKEAAISEAEKRQKIFAAHGMIDEVVDVEAIGYAEDGNLEIATEDMKRNAVENILMQLTSDKGAINNEYQQVSNEYNKYVRNITLVSAQTVGGILEIKGKAKIDKGMLLADVVQAESQSAKMSYQGINQPFEDVYQVTPNEKSIVLDDSAIVSVFLRVVGSMDSKLNEVIVNKSYDDALQAKNFKVAVDDDALQNGLGKYEVLSYPEYSVLMKQRAINLGQEIKIVVVGEVATESVLADDVGITQKATVNMEVYDVVNNRQVGKMTSDYFARGIDVPSAEAEAIQKAANESARVIVQEISRYIDTRKASTI